MGTGDGWDATLEALEQQRTAARAMGGDERLTRHRAFGKRAAEPVCHSYIDP
jgi:hypothetical protein